MKTGMALGLKLDGRAARRFFTKVSSVLWKQVNIERGKKCKKEGVGEWEEGVRRTKTPADKITEHPLIAGARSIFLKRLN